MGISYQKVWDNNKLWPRSHLTGISYRKASDNNKFWPRSHLKGISYRKAWDNNKLWLKSQNKGLLYHLSGNNKRLWRWKFQCFASKIFVRIFMQYQLIFFSCNGKMHEKSMKLCSWKKVFLVENVILQDKGLSHLHKNSLVEATEGCDINPGRIAICMQVHKICETNFVDLHFNEQGN
jgi:hypothetical protein